MSTCFNDFCCRYYNALYSNLIDYEELCRDAYYNYYWKAFGNLPRFIRRFEEAVYGKNASSFEHCIHNTKINVAIVHFYIDSSSNDLINKIVKTPRVTTADILSNIGQFTIMILPFLNILNFFKH